MVPSKWMQMHAPGYAALSRSEKLAIRDFALLWSFFEDKWLANYGNVRAIIDAVDHRVTAATPMEEFEPALNHFKDRYFAAGQFTGAFTRLRFQNHDRRNLVETVISGSASDPPTTLKALLIIVFRLRNNYLHGEKWIYGFQGQLANFKHANAVLMSAMAL